VPSGPHWNTNGNPSSATLSTGPVAQPAVAAGEPGDGPFDQRPVLAVVGQPIRVTSTRTA
jgi:hypothetical protein